MNTEPESVATPTLFIRPTLLILRGPPGSGKSTVASILEALQPEITAVISLDQFRFVDGKYVFDKNRELEVVASYEKALQEAFKNKTPLIIVPNVHSRLWEYERLTQLGEAHGYRVFVLEVQNSFKVCCSRQSHGVPFAKMVSIFERWEPGIQFSLKDRIEALEHKFGHVMGVDQK